MSSGIDAALTLPDGRVVEYFDGGDPAGRPVFHQPGTPATRTFGRLWHAAAAAAGARLITLSRPGYGASTPVVDRPSLAAAGRDIPALADLLGLSGYAVLGTSGGGPFAVATAAADPARVRALGVVVGAGPWRDLADPSAEPEERACLARLDDGDLAGARAGLRHLVEDVWQADLRRLDGDARLDAWLAGDPMAHDDDHRALMARAMNEVLAGTEGALFDTLAHGAGWDIDLGAVEAPALLWYGDADEQTPVSYGRWYADRIAGAELVVLPGEDHLGVADNHRGEFFTALLGAWR